MHRVALVSWVRTADVLEGLPLLSLLPIRDEARGLSASISSSSSLSLSSLSDNRMLSINNCVGWWWWWWLWLWNNENDDSDDDDDNKYDSYDDDDNDGCRWWWI